MSRENVEVARAAMERFIAGETEFDADGALTRMAGEEHWHPDIELDVSEAVVPEMRGVFRGKEAVRRWWGEWLGAWETVEFEYELRDAGNRVVALIDQRMRGRSTGIEVSRGKYAQVGSYEEGKLVHWRFYGDQAEALEAVGLSEQVALAVSQEKVELVRSIYAAWERGDFASAEWAHPEVEFTIIGGPDPGSWTGVAGMAAGWYRFLEAWDDFHVKADEYREIDDMRLLVLIHRSGRGRTSRMEVGQMQSKAADLFHVRDGKVTKLVHYWERERALADLGLSE